MWLMVSCDNVGVPVTMSLLLLWFYNIQHLAGVHVDESVVVDLLGSRVHF